MKLSKILAMLILMVVLVVGCSGTPEADPTAAPAATAPSEVEVDDAPEEEAADAAADSAETTAEDSMMDEEITLQYIMWDPSFEETEQIMVDKFMAANPNVTIDFQTIGTPDYWTKLEALSAANELPCVFNMSAGFVDQWITDGLLYDIQSYVDSDINTDDYYNGVFDVVRDKNSGNMHAFPFAFVETVMFYNKDAFDAAGVDYPAEGWTWDDFLAAAQATTVDEGDDGVVEQYGYWFYGRYAHIESWVYQNDGRFLNENKTRFAPDANAIEALSFLDDLVHEYGVAPEPKEMEGIRQQDVFGLGLAAMWVDGAWNINGNRETIGDEFNWGIAPIPRGPQATGDTAYGWPDSMSVGAACEHPDVAWDFINFMTGPERTIDLTFPGKIPVYTPVAFSDEFLEADQVPDNKGLLLEWANNTGPTSFTPGWGEWRGYTDGAGLEGQFGEVINGEIDLETALANITEHANGVLTRFYPTGDEDTSVPVVAPEDSAESNITDEEVTLQYIMWDPSFEDTEQLMVDKFMAEYPNVTVDFQTIGTPDYWTKLEALSAADELPCVFNMSAGFVDQWISDGLLYDIESYVQRDIDTANYYNGVFDVVRDKNSGNMHAFPFAFVETVMFYNKDAFDVAGVDYPAEGWTWDEFLTAAQALTVDEGDDGLVEQYGYWFYGRYAHIESWVYQNDGRFLNENKTRFEADANAIEALGFLDSLIHEHGVAPEPKEMEGIRQQDVFGLGLAAMWVDGAWNINGNRETIGNQFNWGIAPIPRGPQASGDTAYGWPDSMAVGSTCEHPDVAWEFINYMTGPERTIDLTFPGKIPVYTPVAFSDEFLEADQLPDNKDFLLDWANNTGPTSFTPGWGEWRGYTDGAGLEGQFGEVINGEIDLDTALENITSHANGVLERYYP